MSWSSEFTVGIEEELLLVDSETHRLADIAEQIVPRIEAAEGAAGFEAHAHEVELRSRPCATASEAAEQLRELRAATRRAGGTVIGCGLHPAAELFDARLTDQPRYARVLEQMRGVIQRTPECALHVHVGMPDAETAVRVHNGLRAHAPLLVALAANSPFWFGRDSGLASARWTVVRAYPRHRIPPYLEDYGHYEEVVASACAHGALPDYTYLWWDVRLHPNLGTVEVREMDAQADLGFAAALTEAVQALARRAIDVEPPRTPTEALAESSFRAARDGVAATLLHGGELRPVPDIARELIGGEPLEALLRAGGGAARSRAAYERGGMRGLLAELVEWTAA